MLNLNCLDCGQPLGSHAKYKLTLRCRKCQDIRHANLIRSKGNPRYINGKYNTKQNNKCVDCHKPISKRSTRCHSCSHTGELHHHYSGGLPRCLDCNKKLGSYRSIRCCSCSKRYFYFLYPEKNPMYIDGRAKYPYPKVFNAQLKQYIREKYNYSCQLCTQLNSPTQKNLHIHHIDYNKKNCNEENLIPLCTKCHAKTNTNREKWSRVFYNIKRRERSMYKCPECGEEMVVAQEPVVSAQDIKEKGELFPTKIVCHVIQLYACAKCNVRIAKTETKDYYSNVD